MTIDVKVQGLNQAIKALQKTENTVNRKAQQAIIRTLLRSRTQMTNEIHSELNLKKKRIRESISLQKANKVTGPKGKLTVSGKAVALLDYAARQTKKGTTFKIKRQGSRQRLPHAFIEPQRSGKDTVFQRVGAPRLPIKPLFGTGVGHVAKDKLRKVREFAGEFLRKEFRRLMRVGN